MIQPIISRIRLAAVYVVILLPVIIYGAVNALQSSNNSPIDWVDSSFSERANYDEFVLLFWARGCHCRQLAGLYLE